MRAYITFLLVLSFSAHAQEAVSTKQQKDADYQGGVVQPYLMNQMSKTDDAQTKSMLMMMMMQSMMQQQSSQKASKKNKENEERLKKERVRDTTNVMKSYRVK